MTALDALLNPRSVALIGASPDSTIIRGRIVMGVRHLPFEGPVVAVSRTHDDILGLPTVKSVSRLPMDMDLAVITVPAIHVADALREAGARGVRAAVVISSGFGEERGEDGAARQAQLVRIAEETGMVLCGPNAEGFLNASAPLAATFSPAAFELSHGEILRPSAGGAVAVVSQSGGIGFSFLNRGAPMGIPFSHVVSTGNEAALDSLTLADYLLDRPETGVVLMFLEGLRRPELLAPVEAKARALGKEIVVAKMGRSEAGASAAASHTGSLAGSYRAFAARMRQLGILMARDQDHAMALIQALSLMGPRRPSGRRMGVLTPSGGAGIWLADVACDQGLEVPELDAGTRADFDALLPAYGASRNPVDVTAQFIFKHGFARALELLAASPVVDGLLVASSMIHPESIERDGDNLRRVAGELTKPVIFCAYTNAHPTAVRLLTEAGFPVYTSSVAAARAMAALADLEAARVQREQADSASHDGPVTAATPLAETPPPGTAADDGLLSEAATRQWLSQSGFATGPALLATSPEQAASYFMDLGGAAALKLQSPQLPHKSDVGGVVLDVRTPEDATRHHVRLTEMAALLDPAPTVEGVLLTPMAAPGIDLIVGLQRDDTFGPMLLVGSGGVLVELVDDAELLPLPASRVEVLAALRRLRCWPMLTGYRGGPAADLEALLTLLDGIGRFALCHRDRLAELDLNPVRVHSQGVSVLDAMARLTPA